MRVHVSVFLGLPDRMPRRLDVLSMYARSGHSPIVLCCEQVGLVQVLAALTGGANM